MSIDSHAHRAAVSYDQHGASLSAFAHVLLEDPALADTLVVETIRSSTQCEKTESRDLRDLALDAFMAWSRTASGPVRAPRDRAPSSPTLEMLHRLPADQRAALALCGFGDHRCRQAAQALGLSSSMVAALLREALLALDDGPATSRR